MLEINDIYPKLFYKSKLLPRIVKKDTKILIFSLSFIWIKYLTLLSTVFVQRGTNVKLLWSPHFLQDNQDQKVNDYQNEKLNFFFKKKVDNFEAINIYDLESNNQELDEYDKKQVLEQTITDVTQISRKVDINIEKEEKDLYHKRLKINTDAYKIIKYYLSKNEFDSILIPNGILYEWGIVARVCKKIKINFCTIESFFGINKNQFCSKWNESCLTWDDKSIEELWKKNYPYKYDNVKKNSFNIWYNKVNSKTNEHSIQFKTKNIEDKKLLKKLNISKNDLVCLMLPSFSYEKNFRLKKYCFKDHTDWIKKTLNFLEKKNVKIIYKCHPIPYDPENDRFNFKESEENSENVIKSLYSKFPENLKIIYPDDNIHINDIIKISDFGVSYWSSSAIELAWQGKKSIICSNIHFANKEFVQTAKNENEYYNYIEECLTSKENCKLSKKLQNLSKYYADVWWKQYPRKIPWDILIGEYNYKNFNIKDTLNIKFHISEYSNNFDHMISKDTNKNYSNDDLILNYLKYIYYNFKKNKKVRCFAISSGLLSTLFKNYKILWNKNSNKEINLLFLLKYFINYYHFFLKKIFFKN